MRDGQTSQHSQVSTLDSSSLEAHVLHYPPHPTRTSLRYCSNKHNNLFNSESGTNPICHGRCGRGTVTVQVTAPTKTLLQSQTHKPRRLVVSRLTTKYATKYLLAHVSTIPLHPREQLYNRYCNIKEQPPKTSGLFLKKGFFSFPKKKELR